MLTPSVRESAARVLGRTFVRRPDSTWAIADQVIPEWKASASRDQPRRSRAALTRVPIPLLELIYLPVHVLDWLGLPRFDGGERPRSAFFKAQTLAGRQREAARVEVVGTRRQPLVAHHVGMREMRLSHDFRGGRALVIRADDGQRRRGEHQIEK